MLVFSNSAMEGPGLPVGVPPSPTKKWYWFNTTLNEITHEWTGVWGPLQIDFTTIAQIRNRNARLQGQYLVTNVGLQGWFYRDLSDDTTADDGVSVIVTANGVRYKRMTISSQAVTGLQVSLDNKVDKVVGRGLSSADFTLAEKIKLGGFNDSLPILSDKGEWQPNTAYIVGDGFSFGTATYRVAVAMTSGPTFNTANLNITSRRGNNGWGPVYGIVPGVGFANGPAVSVFKLVDFVGGEGLKPTVPANTYVAFNGTYTTDIIAAANIRGSNGIDGRSIRSGTGVPDANSQPPRGDGVLDSYINISNGDTYRQFGSGTWILSGNIGGAQGSKGDTGNVGPIGQTGSTGIQGIKGDQGFNGWEQIVANITDGNRIVQQVVNWFGGEGPKPPIGQFVGSVGFVETAALATDIRGLQGVQGNQGLQGFGAWVPTLANVMDGERRVLQIVDWFGGTGPKPTENRFLGSTGFVATAALAMDIRGMQGLRGWQAVNANVSDGNRVVQKVFSWIGGEGTAPTEDRFIGPSGFVATAALATDIRGMQGLPGTLTTSAFPDVTVVDDTLDRVAIQRGTVLSRVPRSGLLDFPAIPNFPAIRPSLTLDFQNSEHVSGRINTVRTGVATRVNRQGLIETVGQNVPRIDYDPVTFACRGLLVEESRTNLQTQSENDAFWTSQSTLVKTASATAGPHGGLVPSYTNTANVTTALQFPFVAGSLLANTTYTRSLYVKPLGGSNPSNRTWMFQGNFAAGGNFSARFNLATQLATQEGLVGTAQIVPAGNGWFRLIHTFTTVAAGSSSPSNFLAEYGPSPDTVTMAAFGAQLEIGTFATSYIPTTTVAVTRGMETLTLPTQGWYNAATREGTILCEAISRSSLTDNGFAFSLNDGTVNNRVDVRLTQGGTGQISISVGGVHTGSTFGVALIGVPYKIGITMNPINSRVSRNGVFFTNPNTGLPAITRLVIGSGEGIALNGHLRFIRYWPIPLSDIQLTTLTA